MSAKIENQYSTSQKNEISVAKKLIEFACAFCSKGNYTIGQTPSVFSTKEPSLFFVSPLKLRETLLPRGLRQE